MSEDRGDSYPGLSPYVLRLFERHGQSTATEWGLEGDLVRRILGNRPPILYDKYILLTIIRTSPILYVVSLSSSQTIWLKSVCCCLVLEWSKGRLPVLVLGVVVALKNLLFQIGRE